MLPTTLQFGQQAADDGKPPAVGLCDRRRPTPLIAHVAGAPGAWPRPTRPRRALGAGVRPSVLPPCAPEAPVAVSSSPARPAAGSGDERRGRAGSRRHPGVRLASASPWRAAGDARHRATRFLAHPRTPSQGASSSVFGSWGVPSAGPMRADTRVAVGGCLFRVLPWPGEAHSPLFSSLQASCHRQLRREREISFQRESL